MDAGAGDRRERPTLEQRAESPSPEHEAPGSFTGREPTTHAVLREPPRFLEPDETLVVAVAVDADDDMEASVVLGEDPSHALHDAGVASTADRRSSAKSSLACCIGARTRHCGRSVVVKTWTLLREGQPELTLGDRAQSEVGEGFGHGGRGELDHARGTLQGVLQPGVGADDERFASHRGEREFSEATDARPDRRGAGRRRETDRGSGADTQQVDHADASSMKVSSR
ncbi:hypothetical protein [Nannocystis punicea]|uniref:Uncharacterized protein n=1 Tax=Nannocystis punicea TaxID=2995304 RepID=A0ABY7H7H5_9BACT|nr:hypothetical protein [Nannocystis poenicansa]WAS95045.1 hypothetical protein O0S08_02690 [Nannocystis poenicansa]